jgi:hypothetical protein
MNDAVAATCVTGSFVAGLVFSSTANTNQTMENYISEKTGKAYIKLGAYQLIGGLLGFAILCYAIYNTGIQGIPVFFIYLAFFLFYTYSIVCSILCIKLHDLALELSYINMILQLMAFAIGGYAYKYIAGVYLSLNLYFAEGFDYSFGFGISEMELKFNTDSEAAYLEINFAALFIIIWIDRLRRKIKKESMMMTTEEIGDE